MLSDLMTTFKHKHWTESSLCDFSSAVNASEAVISHANTAFLSSPEEEGAIVYNNGVPAATLTACRLAIVKSPAASRAALQKYRGTIDTALARLLEIVKGYEHTVSVNTLHFLKFELHPYFPTTCKLQVDRVPTQFNLYVTIRAFWFRYEESIKREAHFASFLEISVHIHRMAAPHFTKQLSAEMQPQHNH